MTDHPYRGLPAPSYWRRSVASVPSDQVDPVVGFRIQVDRDTKVATAGSCFAQHIARHLKMNGFNYYVTEPGHSVLGPDILSSHNYGVFSARYGNIYTSRQLIQLMDRAFGRFEPIDHIWTGPNGAVIDAFRPVIQPGGYISETELLADRQQHLARVRSMLKTLDVFVFTLGLTECWCSTKDGAVYPVCPGVEGGVFDPEAYAFINLGVDDVVADLEAFLGGLRVINPTARVILTVSPVPLVATAVQNTSVLAATTYSKSVLRVAAEEIRRRHNHVDYFPSYEVITGGHARGSYFADDLRSVTEEGVTHVMSLFLKHAAHVESGPRIEVDTSSAATRRVAVARLQALVCEEELLDKGD